MRRERHLAQHRLDRRQELGAVEFVARRLQRPAIGGRVGARAFQACAKLVHLGVQLRAHFLEVFGRDFGEEARVQKAGVFEVGGFAVLHGLIEGVHEVSIALGGVAEPEFVVLGRGQRAVALQQLEGAFAER